VILPFAADVAAFDLGRDTSRLTGPAARPAPVFSGGWPVRQLFAGLAASTFAPGIPASRNGWNRRNRRVEGCATGTGQTPLEVRGLDFWKLPA